MRIEHLIGNKGYKIEYMDDMYFLYFLSEDYEVQYGMYHTLDMALECGQELLDTVRLPS